MFRPPALEIRVLCDYAFCNLEFVLLKKNEKVTPDVFIWVICTVDYETEKLVASKYPTSREGWINYGTYTHPWYANEHDKWMDVYLLIQTDTYDTLSRIKSRLQKQDIFLFMFESTLHYKL